LSNCKEEDSWYKEATAEKSETLKQFHRQKAHAMDQVEPYQNEIRALSTNLETCVNQCKLDGFEECVQSMQQVESNGAFGFGKKTVHEVWASREWNQLSSAVQEEQAASDAQWNRYKAERDQRRAAEVEKQKAARRQKKEKSSAKTKDKCCVCEMIPQNEVNLLHLFKGGISGGVEAAKTKQTCTAADCGVYPDAYGGRACRETQCGSYAAPCPRDTGYFGRGGHRNY